MDDVKDLGSELKDTFKAEFIVDEKTYDEKKMQRLVKILPKYVKVGNSGKI